MKKYQKHYADVCVIIPVFNRVEKAIRALESVLNQTVLPRQVIIVDDGSRESEKARIRFVLGKLNNSTIEYIEIGLNSGAQAARQLGFSKCISSYVAFLDCDDWWSDGHLSTLVSTIESGGFVLCASNISVSGKEKYVPLVVEGGIITLVDLFYDNHIGSFSCALIKSSTLQTVGGLHKIASSQDWSTWLDLAQKGSLLKLSDPTCFYDDTVDTQRISMNFDAVIAGHSEISRKILLLAQNEMPRLNTNIIEANLCALLLRRLHFAKAPRKFIFQYAFHQVFFLNRENAKLYFSTYFRVFFFPRTLPAWARWIYKLLRFP